MNRPNRLERAATFDRIAELYDAARREYPHWLFDELFGSIAIDAAKADILEVGCGTGQATLSLAQRASSVVAVEMGPHLARIARRKTSSFSNIEIVDSRFEDWKPARRFDLVAAFTSWHWIDPEARYVKAAAALKPGGTLAFTVNEHVFPPGYDPFFVEIQDCYESIGVGRLPFPPPSPDSIPDARGEIEACGYFEDIRVIRRLWTQEFSADEYVAMMNTASDHLLMEPWQREQLFAEMHRLIGLRPQGRILKHNLTMLHLARLKVQPTLDR